MDFYGKGFTAVDIENQPIKGRGRYGGIAIMWRKTLGHMCRIISFNDPRIMGIIIQNDKGSEFQVLNVYMPTSCNQNSDEFLYYLSMIEGAISAFQSPLSFVFGDLNAHISHTGHDNHLFGQGLLEFCHDENLVLADLDFLPVDSYTFVSQTGNNAISWLDYVVCTSSA